MKYTNTRIDCLKKLMALEERRVTLQAQLDAVVSEMSGLQSQFFVDSNSDSTTASTSTRSTASSRGTRKNASRVLLKDKIYAALETAGEAGVKVKDLAEAIGTKAVNVHSWFHSAMKKDPSIVKIVGGHYRQDHSGTATKSKPKATKAKPRQSTKRGLLTEQIVSLLKDAGNEGITVADIADKLSAKYKNIYIWFATTGKKHNGVKKVGPAKYKLV